MYNATVKLCYINDTDANPSKYFPEIVDKQTITIEAPAGDLNVHQHFELFKSFLRAMDFSEYSIMDGACRLAFNDGNDEAQMKKLMEEYELQDKQDSYLSHKETEQICEFLNGKESAWNEIEDNRVRETLQLYIDRDHRVYDKLEKEVSELKEKLTRVLPEQYVEEYVDPDYPKDDGTSWNSWNGLVPGSPEAVAKNCQCPILDNQEMPNDKKWVNADCPLHGKTNEKSHS